MIGIGTLIILGVLLQHVVGHGMMWNPPNRSSLWRFNTSFPINYEDNQNFCGGYATQWNIHGGKCGVCGDNYGDAIPRENENTGVYGLGYVVAQYPSGSVMNVTIKITANHKGTFSYSLCKLLDYTKAEEENCFQPLLFADGSETFQVNSDVFNITNLIQLPKDLVCDRCVLRWHYRTGNHWGQCEDGSGAVGCGPQETFRSCSDIAIY
ncbi:hypothetical protein RI129_003368 [Pyrocoelia pectoralis]|uniref:Chitin-binding type-4 domain-containing protein n=1 Tax=Pyrocoelia pectoralis TaxID=417401 RepID=A0AAN7VNX0_9COLE